MPATSQFPAGTLLIQGNVYSGDDLNTGITSNSGPRATGRGGDVSVAAGTLTIDGTDPDKSAFIGISSDSRNASEGGNAGRVDVKVSEFLDVRNGGRISSDTHG